MLFLYPSSRFNLDKSYKSKISKHPTKFSKIIIIPANEELNLKPLFEKIPIFTNLR